MKIDLKSLWSQRPVSTNKLACGRLLCLAGSEETIFPAYLNLLSALRSGIGWMILATSQTVCRLLSPLHLEVKMLPLPIDSNKRLELQSVHKRALKSSLRQSQAVVVGCGLGAQDDLYKYLKELLALIPIPSVIDAAALFYFWKHRDQSPRIYNKQIWTPNPWELKQLFGSKFFTGTEKYRLQTLRSFSQTYGMVWIYKYEYPRIINADGVVYEHTYGNGGLACTGVGDVLSGLIGSFLAQGMTLVDACKAGMTILGLSGDLCYKHFGNGLRASDLCEKLPAAIQQFVTL